MTDLQSPFQSWFELYQRFAMVAESTRGMITVTDPDEGTINFPRTTSKDAYAVAVVFDRAIHEHASEVLASRWECESDLLAGESDDDPSMYVGNRSFWSTLALAAAELDRAYVALPDPREVDEAMGELRTPRQVTEPRNGGAILVTVFSSPSWSGMARRQLEFFRRLRGIEGDAALMPDIPRTCNADVQMLASYWTEQLARIGRSAGETCGRLVHACWRDILERVARHARGGMPHCTFAHNDEFWQALFLLATQSDACNEEPAPWTFRGPSATRNAAPVDTGATLDFPAAKTWDEAAQMQRDAFSKLRGEDVVTGRLISRVPRTTHSDVRQVADYWRAGLARVGEHSFADVSYRHVLDRWRAALADVERIPTAADPAAVYAHNTDFWEAVVTIAIQVAVTAEAPTKWQLAKAATKQAITNLPDTLRSAIGDVAAGLLAKPLLYAGVGLSGLAFLAFLLRRPAPRAADREIRS